MNLQRMMHALRTLFSFGRLESTLPSASLMEREPALYSIDDVYDEEQRVLLLRSGNPIDRSMLRKMHDLGVDIQKTCAFKDTASGQYVPMNASILRQLLCASAFEAVLPEVFRNEPPPAVEATRFSLPVLQPQTLSETLASDEQVSTSAVEPWELEHHPHKSTPHVLVLDHNLHVQRRVAKYLTALGFPSSHIRPITLKDNLHHGMKKYQPDVLFVDESWLEESHRLGVNFFAWLGDYYEQACENKPILPVFVMSTLQIPLPLGEDVPPYMKLVLLPKPFASQQFYAVVAEPLQPLVRTRVLF